MSEHFDAAVTDDERSPNSFEKVEGVAAVLVDRNTGRLVLTGSSREDYVGHNCDQRGCGSLEHKIAEFDINPDAFPPRPKVGETDG